MTENPEMIAHAFRVLGALFYRSPHDAGMDSLTAYLAGEQLAEEWPWGDPAALAAIAGDFAAGAASPTLAAEHQRLFIGPDALPAPPWGSVYLDRENCLFGETTVDLANFCKVHEIEFVSGQNEPPDHFGLVCAIGAILCESGREALMPEFLSTHLLPWSGRFLEHFEEATAQSPFYRAAGRLASLSLAALSEQWQLTPAKFELFA